MRIPIQRGLRRTLRGIGGVYRPLSTAGVYRPTREVPLPDDDLDGAALAAPSVPGLAVARPSAERPLPWARPGPVFALAMGREVSHRHPGDVDGPATLDRWPCGSWSSTTTTRS